MTVRTIAGKSINFGDDGFMDN
ncbi:MAG: hypothetical protein KC418_21805, partial [Anaerolineales bacterium]|nr:hypothetical protein [Anaerolineales bacterium]